jgi:hypothetical protein
LKVNDFDDVARDNLDQWIYYLKNDAIPERFTAPGLPEARERLSVDRLSPSERSAYHAHLEQLQHEYSVLQTAEDKGWYRGEEERKKLQKTVDIQEEKLVEKDEILAQKDEALAQKEEVLAQKEEVLAQKEEVLAQKDSTIVNTVKNLIDQGFSPQQVAQIMQLEIEEVKKYI